MAKTSTIKLVDKCGRCPREQERIVTLDEAIEHAKRQASGAATAKKDFEIFFKGDLLASYDFLCDPCLNTVAGYAGAATRAMQKKSSTPVRKQKEKSAPAPAEKPPSKK